MAEDWKGHPSFFSRIKKDSKYRLECQLKTGIFLSFLSSLVSIEVMTASVIGQKAFPGDPNTVNEFLTKAYQQDYSHLTNGAIIGIVGLGLSLIALIYLVRKLKEVSTAVIYRRAGEIIKEPYLNASFDYKYRLQNYYQAQNINPDKHTLMAVFKGQHFITIPRECYDRNELLVDFFHRKYGGKTDKDDINIPPYLDAADNYIVKDLPENEKRVDPKLKPSPILKIGMIVSGVAIVASIELLVASTIGISAFPQDPNSLNSYLIHPLQQNNIHLTNGTLLGIVGLVLSLITFIYLTKKFRSLNESEDIEKTTNIDNPTETTALPMDS